MYVNGKGINHFHIQNKKARTSLSSGLNKQGC